MANRASPTHRANKLQSLFAILCLIVFAAIPMTCTAAIVPSHPVHMQADCSPCCHHAAPAQVQQPCCVMQQDEAPTRIAYAPALTLEAASMQGLAALQTEYAAMPIALLPRTRSASPPPLLALRI